MSCAEYKDADLNGEMLFLCSEVVWTRVISCEVPKNSDLLGADCVPLLCDRNSAVFRMSELEGKLFDKFAKETDPFVNIMVSLLKRAVTTSLSLSTVDLDLKNWEVPRFNAVDFVWVLTKDDLVKFAKTISVLIPVWKVDKCVKRSRINVGLTTFWVEVGTISCPTSKGDDDITAICSLALWVWKYIGTFCVSKFLNPLEEWARLSEITEPVIVSRYVGK